MLTLIVAWAAKQTKSPELCAFFLLSIPADTFIAVVIAFALSDAIY